MSTNPPPAGRQSPQVYRRRRLVVLLGLVAVIVAVVLIFVRPGASQGDDSGPTPKSTQSSAPATPDATTIPTEPVAVDGDPCAPEQITVEAVTDKTSYNAGEQPQLSVTITNTCTNICVLNAGTKAQVSLDVFNLFNSNTTEKYQLSYGTTYLDPLQITAARFFKISAQLDF